MKKITQAFVFLSLVLSCLFFKVQVVEARFRHLGEERSGAFPSKACRSPPKAYEVTRAMKRPCIRTRRPPRLN
ncbi:unnamed protein product [Cochlearia groenlandica]